jgi:hypothetical protein
MLRYWAVGPDYFLEIESHFAARRGTPFILNAKDWALMQEWAAEGIPLPVVIEAIDSVFDKAAERNKTVNGLRYCRHAVKDIWKERRELSVGAAESSPEAGSSEALQVLAEKLAQSSNETIRTFAARVLVLGSEKSVPRIEERLMELEQELVDALATPEIRAEALRLAQTADEKTRARTEQAHIRRLVREELDLPRLTLFGG